MQLNSHKNLVLLIYPQVGINPLLPQPPLSLLSLAPYIEDKGLTPVIIDQRVEHDCTGKIRELLPNTLFVGITSMTGEQLNYAVEMIELVKSLSSSTPVVFGGIHASLLPEQAIKTDGVDIVVIGEGERVIADIAGYYAHEVDISDISGICYKTDGQIFFNHQEKLMDLEYLKTPSWHLIDKCNYTDFTIQAGRGCPFECAFCYNTKFNGGQWRFRNPEAIVEEIKYLHLVNGITDFFFVDDNFFTSLQRVEKICRLIIKNNLQITWKATCRADYFKNMTDSFIELMKKSGVKLLFVGGESGSPEVLKRINKQITVDDIVYTAETAARYTLPVTIGFMTGFPFETAEDRDMTFELMDRIKKIYPTISMDGFNVYTPYPGNDLYEESKRYGLIEPTSLCEWSTYVFNMSNLPWLSKAQNRMLENISFISRFCFWQVELKDRYLKKWYYPFFFILRLSAVVRWKLRAFCCAIEWDVFRLVRRKYF